MEPNQPSERRSLPELTGSGKKIRLKVETMNPREKRRMSHQFEEMRAFEKKDSGVLLQDRITAIQPGATLGRRRSRTSLVINLNSAFFSDLNQQEELQKANRLCCEMYHTWKQLKKGEPELPLPIGEQLTLLSKFYDMGIKQFSDQDVFLSLSQILAVMYKSPYCKRIFEASHEIEDQFASVNFKLKDYGSIRTEARLLEKLLKKYNPNVLNLITRLGEFQEQLIEEFPFMTFIQGLKREDIVKSGLIKEKDVPQFFYKLKVHKIGSLPAEYLKSKMLDVIIHPKQPLMVFGGTLITLIDAFSLDALKVLQQLIHLLTLVEGKPSLMEDEELTIKIQIALTQMGKIKERLQIGIEEMVTRLLSFDPLLDQITMRQTLVDAFPENKQRDWCKAFELLTTKAM